jgi:hypothetical protein
MFPARVQLPTFLTERGIRQQALSALPADVRDRLLQQVEIVRRWVAEPAFQQGSGSAAVDFVVRAVGPMAELRSELVAIVASAEHGLDVLLGMTGEEAGDDAPDEDPLADVADLVQRAQRRWVRFVSFHPDLEPLARDPDRRIELTDLSNSAFYADVFLTISAMANDREKPVDRSVLEALQNAARDYATKYYNRVRSIVESCAPTVDAGDPFKPVTLDALLALPPYDGPVVGTSAMDKAVERLFRSR